MSLQNLLNEWRLDNPIESVFNGGEEFHWDNDPYIRVTCPFCAQNPKLGPDKGHHCYAHEKWFKCMRCGTKGGNTLLLGREINQKPTEKWTEFQLEVGSKKPKHKKLVDLFGGPAAHSNPGRTIWLGDLNTSHPAWQYLLSEKFSQKEILQIMEHFPIHYCAEGRQFTHNEKNTTSNRLIFTIIERGQQIGWQARHLPNHWPPTAEDKLEAEDTDRYITSPGLKKSFTLYNIENALKWDTIVVVEGVKKVWKTGLFSVGTFGVGNNCAPPEGITDAENQLFWLNRLAKASQEGREIWFLYDRDGMINALQHTSALEALGAKSSLILLPRDNPPDVDDYYRPELLNIIFKRKGRLPRLLPHLIKK